MAGDLDPAHCPVLTLYYIVPVLTLYYIVEVALYSCHNLIIVLVSVPSSERLSAGLHTMLVLGGGPSCRGRWVSMQPKLGFKV